MNKLVNLILLSTQMEKITTKELSKILDKFPEDTKICRIVDNNTLTYIRLYSSEFKEIKEAELIPEVRIELKTGYDDMGLAQEYFDIPNIEEFLETYAPVKLDIVWGNDIPILADPSMSPSDFKFIPHNNEIYEYQQQINSIQNQIIDNQKLMGVPKFYFSNPDLKEQICECGKEKHGFARHLQFCKMYE